MARPGLLRVGWNLVDQVISSATNALLSFLIARTVSDSDFGGFSVAFTIFSVFIGVSRALAASPLSVRFAGTPQDEFRRATASGVGAALALGLAGGLGCVTSGLFLGDAVGTALVALGVALPGLLVQDAWRLVFFAEARPRAAAANDAAWAVLQLSAIVALVELGVETLGPLTLAWGLAACAAALLGVRQSGTRPAPGRALAWLRHHRDLTKYLVLEYVTVQGGYQLALLAIAGIGSLVAVGALRGSQVLLGPATILAVGLASFALPEMSRRRTTSGSRGWLLGAMALSGAVTLFGLVWGGFFLLAPDRLGVALLGDTWSATKSVLVASVVQQAGSSLALGPTTMLYAMDRARVTLRVHAVLAPLLLLGGISGVSIGGAEGAAWGFAAAFWLVAPAWWVMVAREGRRVAAHHRAARAEAAGEVGSEGGAGPAVP